MFSFWNPFLHVFQRKPRIEPQPEPPFLPAQSEAMYPDRLPRLHPGDRHDMFVGDGSSPHPPPPHHQYINLMFSLTNRKYSCFLWKVWFYDKALMPTFKKQRLAECSGVLEKTSHLPPSSDMGNKTVRLHFTTPRSSRKQQFW